MQKKLIAIISSAVVLVGVVVCCVVFGTQKPHTHTHEFGEWTIVKQATCEENGTQTRKCNGCDETEQETIQATGHAYGDWVEEIQTTCLEEGTKGHYECSACNKYFDENHNKIENLTIEKAHALHLVEGKEATCTENGETDVYRCSACREFFDENGEPVTDRVIPAKGHAYGDWIDEVPATATEKGEKGHKDCTSCGLHFDADENELESLVIPATEHDCGAWIDEIPATCTENGVKGHYECRHCSLSFDKNYDVIEQLTIPAAHDFKFSARLEPTCEKDGHIALYYCENCSAKFDENMNETEDFDLKKLGHEFGDWIEEIAPTCTQNGVKAHKTCSRCEKDFDKDGNEINAKLSASHTFTVVPELSATCTENGHRAYKHCSVCGKNYDVFGAEVANTNDLVLPARNHDYGNWINKIEVSCTDAGLIGHYHCRICNKDFDENHAEITDVFVPALGHHYTTKEIIPEKVSCLEDGYIAHFECDRCNLYVDADGLVLTFDDIVIEKTGHTEGEYVYSEEPTCTESGKKDYYKCETCSEPFLNNPYKTLTEEELHLQPTGHNYVYYEKEEYCDREGRAEHYMCSNCYKVFNTNKEQIDPDSLEIQETGHDFGDWVERKEPTETEDGYKGHYQCKKCLYYFGEDKKQIGSTIVIPKKEHLFNPWVDEVPATCTTDGTKGHRLCTRCNKYFDSDYQEITDGLTIPAHHNVGELIPASQGKCYEEEVSVPYYKCSDCHFYFDESMNVLRYENIFRTADRHDDVLIQEMNGVWEHTMECRDCGRTRSERHKYEISYITENNVPLQKATCKVCGYVHTDTYYVVNNVYLATDMYVGYHNDSMMLFTVEYRDGNKITVSTRAVMNEEDAKRFNDILNSSPADFTGTTEKFTVSFLNFTSEIEITFRPFIVYGVVTSEKAYEYLSDLWSVEFIYDCNYTRNTGDVLRLSGDISDDGGFADFDFAASGLDEKTFTIKYTVNSIEYDVYVTLVSVRKPACIEYDEYGYIMLGGRLTVWVVYSDGSKEYVDVTDEIITSGTFDPNIAGEQVITVSIKGLVKTIAVKVRDPYEVSYIYVTNDTISLGEKLKIGVSYLNNDLEYIEVTSDMIEGKFDNNIMGVYDITVVYEGKTWCGEIKVINPDDSRVESIEPMKQIYEYGMVWDVKDGKLVENLDYLFIRVSRYDDTYDSVKVTDNMISYDKAEAEEAIASAGYFRLLITYYGKTCTVKIAPRVIADCEVRDIRIYDKTAVFSGDYVKIFIPNGDLSNLSNYFVYARTQYGCYGSPVTKDMLYIEDENGVLVPFDFDKAENAKLYGVTLRYGEAQDNYNRIEMVIYSESDVSYEFYDPEYNNVAIGTKEEVLARLAGIKFYFGMRIGKGNYCYRLIEEFYFEELVIAPNEYVDFGTPGYIQFEASYKGVVGWIRIELVPDVDGVDYKKYFVSQYDTLTLYENGYAYYRYSWGTYSCINEQLGLWQINMCDGGRTLFFTIDGTVATEFLAEMLEDNHEIYTLFSMDGFATAHVYTKNGLSLADIYDEDNDYDETVRVTFSADGKYIYIRGVKYTIGKDNALVIVPEGDIVYRYYDDSDGMYYKGTLNDNGLFYFYVGVTDSYGAVLEEYLVDVYAWKENNGVVTLYYNDSLVASGVLVDGYLVLDIA